MKLLTTAIFFALMSGCAAHAHPPTPQPSAHAHVQVKAWVWVNGHWQRGHWVRGHWAIRHVRPHLIQRNPHRYIHYRSGRPNRPPPRQHRRR